MGLWDRVVLCRSRQTADAFPHNRLYSTRLPVGCQVWRLGVGDVCVLRIGFVLTQFG